MCRVLKGESDLHSLSSTTGGHTETVHTEDTHRVLWHWKGQDASDILFDDEYFLYRRQLVDFSVRKLPI